MKIFISQKMRNKTHEEIEIERERIKNEFLVSPIHFKDYGGAFYSQDFIQSYKPELKHKSPIDALSHSLAMLDEADIVLVPKKAKENVTIFTVKILNWNSEFSLLRGCEFEFLIAKSYGKKVYTYDDNYTFVEV